jgi:D-alanyl-D-alanine carboxypeptidase
MNLLQEILSMAAAGTMMLTSALDTLTPQHDVKGFLFLTNRAYGVAQVYEPDDLREAQVQGSVRRMCEEASLALEEMFAACREETGLTLISVSGYRSWSKQNNIWQRKLRSVKKNVEKAQEYVAPPGASEHQLGLAMDIGQKSKAHLTEAFGKTEGGKWALENCWRFGFILRYAEEWEEITGYKFEPWHFRYVGRKYAKEIHDAGIPFETWLIRYRTDLLTGLLEEGTE